MKKLILSIALISFAFGFAQNEDKMTKTVTTKTKVKIIGIPSDDYQLKSQLQRIQYPKFVLTNALYKHANAIVNKLGIEDEFIK